MLQKPSAEDKAAIDQAIDRALQVLPEMLAGDMQAAIQKLHSGERAEAGGEEGAAQEGSSGQGTREERSREPQKSGGLLKSLFGKK